MRPIRALLAQMMKRAFWSVLFGVFLPGCALLLGVSPSDVEEAKKVRIVSNPAAVGRCEYIGQVHGRIDTFWGGGTDTLLTQMRAKAARAGANAMVLIGSLTTVKQTHGSDMMADANTYRCPQSPAESETKRVVSRPGARDQDMDELVGRKGIPRMVIEQTVAGRYMVTLVYPDEGVIFETDAERSHTAVRSTAKGMALTEPDGSPLKQKPIPLWFKAKYPNLDWSGVQVQ